MSEEWCHAEQWSVLMWKLQSALVYADVHERLCALYRREMQGVLRQVHGGKVDV